MRRHLQNPTAVEEVVLRSWWVVLFLLICYAVYEQGSMYLYGKMEYLQGELVSLETERLHLIDEERDLRLQIASQSDYSWRELAMIGGLGMVPEGYRKVVFVDREED
jgi:hypothetical protein